MARPIRFSIEGRNTETDAPTVEDLLAQVGDWFGILRCVESAIADDASNEIEWRVTGASKSSPLALELTPYPRQHGMNIDQRVQAVKEHTAAGLAILTTRAERPSYFTDQVLEKVERVFQRVTNGLSLTRIEFGDQVPNFEIATPNARPALANAIAVRKPKEKPYWEIGSLEGHLQRVEKDGYGRPLLFIKLRLDGETIKCVARGSALAEAERHRIGEIWKNYRVRLSGKIHYKSLGSIAQMECDLVEFLPEKGTLPTSLDIVDKNFTGGMKSEDYLEKLRNGELS